MKTKALTLFNLKTEIIMGVAIITASLVIGFLARDILIDLQANFFGDGREWGFF